MSMLSAQADELRAMAESVGLEMPQAATLMIEAADTILSLRDRAQDLQAENDKLREVVSDGEESARLILDESRALQAENTNLRKYMERKRDLMHFARLVDENSKFRELVADMWLQLLNAYDRKEVDEFANRMRELGVEL